VRRQLLAVAAALALTLAVPAAGARQAVVPYKIVSARASATLTFHTQNSDQSEISDGTVKLVAASKGSGMANVPGRAFVALKGSVNERVKTTRASDSSPYQETCTDSRKVGGKGGIALRRVGKRVEVRWAFPQAKASFCHGPKVGTRITSKMKRLYPASKFQRKRVTLVVSGSGKAVAGTTSLVYRWKATVTLSRS